jgi:hypothetical protein
MPFYALLCTYAPIIHALMPFMPYDLCTYALMPLCPYALMHLCTYDLCLDHLILGPTATVTVLLDLELQHRLVQPPHTEHIPAIKAKPHFHNMLCVSFVLLKLGVGSWAGEFEQFDAGAVVSWV